MKKTLVLISIILFSTSCSVDTDLNIDQKKPTEASGSPLFVNGTRNLFDLMNSCSVNRNVFRLYAQYWAQTTYPEESQYNQINRNIGGSIWNTLYKDVLKDLDGAKIASQKTIKSENPNKENQLAAIEFMSVYAYSILVDTFGDVPYSEALDPNNPSPKYDKAEIIYIDLLKRLDVAINKFDTGQKLGYDDPIYEGNITKWKKAASSLLLRLAMRIADADAVNSIKYADKAATYGVILNNTDNFSINYLKSSPNTNPLYVSLVQSGRRDFIISNTFVDALQPRVIDTFKATTDVNNDGKVDEKDDIKYIKPGSFSYTDPRVFKYFKSNKIISEKIDYKDSSKKVILSVNYENDYKNQKHLFKGGTYGSANSSSENTQIGAILEDPSLKGTIISASEIRFLLAEASARGGYSVSGDVATHYNEGVKASLNEWGADEAYALEGHVAYATASGDWKEKIATQKWIALFNNGFEGWTTWRIFDSPKLNLLPVKKPESTPTRFLYPVSEATLNGKNYILASKNIGGDKKSTKIFWDKN